MTPSRNFNEVIDLKPDDKDLAVAYFYLGVANRMLEHYDDAIDAFTTSLQLNPDDPETYLRRGIVWFYKGEYSIAWNDFDESAAIIYDDPRPEFWKGLTLARQGKWLDAVNTYAVAIRIDPRYVPAYVNRGLAYLVINEPLEGDCRFRSGDSQRSAQCRKLFQAWNRIEPSRQMARSGRFVFRSDPVGSKKCRSVLQSQLGVRPTGRTIEIAERSHYCGEAEARCGKAADRRRLSCFFIAWASRRRRSLCA